MLIQPGQSISANTVAQGGIALRGVGTGTTLVAATIAGFTPMGAATVAVDVTQSGIALLGLPPALGAGLQTIPLVARLTDGSHGGVTMRIAAADPAAVLVSADPAAVGTDTLAVFMPNGTRDVVFHLQALEGASGATTVTAAVAGFTPGARPLDVVAPAVAVTLLPDSLDVADPRRSVRGAGGRADGRPDGPGPHPGRARRRFAALAISVVLDKGRGPTWSRPAEPPIRWWSPSRPDSSSRPGRWPRAASPSTVPRPER